MAAFLDQQDQSVQQRLDLLWIEQGRRDHQGRWALRDECWIGFDQRLDRIHAGRIVGVGIRDVGVVQCRGRACLCRIGIASFRTALIGPARVCIRVAAGAGLHSRLLSHTRTERVQ
jgi:hypothetical protein